MNVTELDAIEAIAGAYAPSDLLWVLGDERVTSQDVLLRLVSEVRRLSDQYERGRFIEYQRAISRTELGLPIERGIEDMGLSLIAEVRRLRRENHLLSLSRGTPSVGED